MVSFLNWPELTSPHRGCHRSVPIPGSRSLNAGERCNAGNYEALTNWQETRARYRACMQHRATIYLTNTVLNPLVRRACVLSESGYSGFVELLESFRVKIRVRIDIVHHSPSPRQILYSSTHCRRQWHIVVL